MNLLTLLFGGNREAKAAQLAETLAARCTPAVFPKLSAHVQTMSVHEARGYIRARARLIVGEEVSQALRDDSLARVMTGAKDFTELVMQSVIRRAQQDLYRRKLQPAASRRAA